MDESAKSFAMRGEGTENAKNTLQLIVQKSTLKIQLRKQQKTQIASLDEQIYEKRPFVIVENKDSISVFALCGAISDKSGLFLPNAKNRDPDLVYVGEFQKKGPDIRKLLVEAANGVADFYEDVEQMGRSKMTAFLNAKNPTPMGALKASLSPETLITMGVTSFTSGSFLAFHSGLNLADTRTIGYGLVTGAFGSLLSTSIKDRLILQGSKTPKIKQHHEKDKSAGVENKPGAPIFFSCSKNSGDITPEGPAAIEFVKSLPVPSSQKAAGTTGQQRLY